MYGNRYDHCDCNRVEGVDDIQKGICKIAKGIQDIRDALGDICKCRLSEAVHCIKKALCAIESGLCDIVKGVSEIDTRDCAGMKMMKDGICDIKKAIKDIQDGLNDICRGRVCEGIDKIHKGLCRLEEGLADVVEGLQDIINDKEIRRKRVSEVLGALDCREEDLCDRVMDCDPCMDPCMRGREDRCGNC